jgi:hypothetical protein
LFDSYATNLHPDDPDGLIDVYVRDYFTHGTSLRSMGAEGSKGNAYSFGGALAAGDRFIAFSSYADNLVGDDTNYAGDVFVQDRCLDNSSLTNCDADSWTDLSEIACGSDLSDAASLPERTDTPADDDGDTLVNEALPPGAEAYDCDGDGYIGGREGSITTSDQDPCGANGWPSDFVTGTPGGFQYNTFNVQDLGSFLAPVRRFGTSPGHPNFSLRWDLVPGGTIGGAINLQDIAATITGASGFPAMFGGQKAFGRTCPYAP